MLTFSPQTVDLKDGTIVELRELSSSDCASLYAMERAVVADGRGVVRTLEAMPESLELFTENKSQSFSSSRSTCIVAMLDGNVVASGQLDGMLPMHLRHIATLAMEVHPDYQGRGLGRAILNALILIARGGFAPSDPAIERLQLFVRADNVRAIALYESAGFEHEGTRRNFVRLPDGSYIDDYTMVVFFI